MWDVPHRLSIYELSVIIQNPDGMSTLLQSSFLPQHIGIISVVLLYFLDFIVLFLLLD